MPKIPTPAPQALRLPPVADIEKKSQAKVPSPDHPGGSGHVGSVTTHADSTLRRFDALFSQGRAGKKLRLKTPRFGQRSIEDQKQIVRRYSGKSSAGIFTNQKSNKPWIKTNQKNLLGLESHPRKMVSPAIFDVLCLAEEINLIGKTIISFDSGNQIVPLTNTGGENWLRVHMSRAAIEKLPDPDPDPDPVAEANIVVAHRAANCWEFAMLAFALASNSGINKPVFALYDNELDHTYVVIGNPWKEPPENVVVIDTHMAIPVAHTLAESTLHFPRRDDVEKIAEFDPQAGKPAKAFSIESAIAQPAVSMNDVRSYLDARNLDREKMNLAPLPKNFGPDFVKVLTDDGDNTDWVFDLRSSIGDVSTVYDDGQGRARSFNAVPADYLQVFRQSLDSDE